jgi:hypothetical protein
MKTRRRYFDFFVVVDTPIGRATKEIINLALRERRPVLRFVEEGFVQVVRTVQVEDDNWKKGWTVAVRSSCEA